MLITAVQLDGIKSEDSEMKFAFNIITAMEDCNL